MAPPRGKKAAMKAREKSTSTKRREEKTGQLKRFLYGDGGFITFSSWIAMTLVSLIFWLDTHWTSLDYIAFPVFILAIMASRLLTDVSTSAEKFLYLLVLTFLVLAASIASIFIECKACFMGVPHLLRTYITPEPGQKRQDAWQLFLHEKNTPQMCAYCLLWVANHFKWVNWLSDSLKDNVFEETFDSVEDFAAMTNLHHEHQDVAGTCPDVLDPTALSPRELREIDEWYVAMRKESAPKKAFEKFVNALAGGNDVGKELLSAMAHDFLCYPTSRLNGPKPSEFLKNIKHPRFTGEENVEGDGPMKIDFEKLVAIMRGDMMKTLQPDVCAMIRIASMLSPDETVLTSAMSAAKIAEVANETELKGQDAGLLFPGIYIPKVDEDKDPDGTAGDLLETLIWFFQRLPIVDDASWFETREEYLALFRWLIEHKIQDEFYFPTWLSTSNGREAIGNDAIGELVADQFRYRGDRQRIFESTSDATLADRAFYGGGVKTLRRIVLPGDPSYGYMVSPEYYATAAEREFFLNKAMPTEQDLLHMASVAWGEPVDDIETLRTKVLQIDYMHSSHWEYRDLFEHNAAILYLDAEKRSPMGIWVACQERLVLPDGGMAWEHAKYIYRCGEIITAAMGHVGEYHLGWASRFNSALKQTLPHTHGLRVLMKPYTHGTGNVNWNAFQMLVLEDSILARADGFTNRGRGHAWGHFVKHSDMKSTFPQTLQAKELEGISNLTTTIPYFHQGTKLWNIHHDYVQKFVDLVYGDDDMALLKDDALNRFWHFLNTGGRHLDPCVCSMDPKMFFEKNKWPSSEDTRTCMGLMDHVGFRTSDTDPVHRRETWCKETVPSERSKALYQWLESDCERSDKCTQVPFDQSHMRPDMGLPELTRESLVNVLTRCVFEVTVGHELAADNIPYIVDPLYGGVRRLKQYDETKQPMVDVSTWIFGVVIATLTTIRSMPLLSDWSGLLESWVYNKDDLIKFSDRDREERKRIVNQLHLEYKTALVENANSFLKETLQRPQNQWSPFLNPSAQACSIAV